MTAFVARHLLTHEEERMLARAVEAGVLAEELLKGKVTDDRLVQLAVAGRAAHERLVLSNVGLVYQFATQAARRLGLPLDELVQEGMVGLLEAVRRYEYRREWRFSTIAAHWIRRRIREASASRCGQLELGASPAKRLHRVRQVAVRLEERLGRPAPLAEVAAEAGVSERAVGLLLGYRSPGPLEGADGRPLDVAERSDFQPHDAAYSQARSLLGALRGRRRQVLAMRYGLGADEPMTPAEVALALGISASTVRRVELAALDELRSLARAQANDFAA